MTKIILLFFLLFGLLASNASATATFAYDADDHQQYYHIFVNGNGNTLNSVYTDIANNSLISKSGNNYTLHCNITVEHNATLTINGDNLKFGDNLIHPTKSLRLWNKGSLQINNSTITSTPSNNSLWGYIECRNLEPYSTGWSFNLTNSTLSNIGPIANNGPRLDEYGEGSQGIYCYGLGGIQQITPVEIGNNKFTGTNGITLGGSEVTIHDNYITQSTANCVWLNTGGHALITKNTWYNNQIYKCIIDWSDAIVYDNNFILNSGGICVDLKEGAGGANISYNTFEGGSYDYTLSLGGSGHTIWSVANNNTISNISGTYSDIGIIIQGNGYDDHLGSGPQSNVMISVENNTVKNVNEGIRVMGIGNFDANFGPQHVLTKNNLVDGCTYGYHFYNAVNAVNVTLVNDTLKNCSGADVYIGPIQTASEVQPKIVDLNYVTKTTHTAVEPGGRCLEYKTLNWSIVDQDSNPLAADISITNNVNTSYPVVYYNDTIVSSLTNVSSISTPAIMLVRKGVNSETNGEITYQNMNYMMNITKAGYNSSNISVYDPSLGTNAIFRLYGNPRDIKNNMIATETNITATQTNFFDDCKKFISNLYYFTKYIKI